MGVIAYQAKAITMSPNQKQHIEQLMANSKVDTARSLLQRLIKEKGDKDAIEMLADINTLYPETRLEKGARAANKLVFYALLGIVTLLVVAVLFGVLWQTVLNR